MRLYLLLLLTGLFAFSTGLAALEIDDERFYVIMGRNDHTFFVKDMGETNLRCLAGESNEAYWCFIPTGNPDCYHIKNLLTGRYAQQVSAVQGTVVTMGTVPVEYIVTETPGEGTDVFGITSTNISNTSFTNGCLGWNWKADGNVIQSYAAAVGTNHRSFFYIQEGNPPSCLIGSHDFADGICSICGTPDGNYLETDEEGFYHLTSARQVEWFSAIVNGGGMSVCAKLDNDIDFTGVEHTPIANIAERKYNGTFDGQGHRISNLVMYYPDRENIGLFGFLRGNDGRATVRNLIIDKSCSFTGAHRVAAITGCSQGQGGLVTLENIVNEADVTATTGTDAGALIGGQINNPPLWNIRNCVNTGKISANGYAGMVAGWMGNNAGSVIENIINLGIIEGFDGDSNMGRFYGITNNLVDLSGTVGAGQGIVEELTADDIASGKLAYYMNGSQDNICFYQTLGEDEYPVPFSTHARVFFNGEMLCDGTPTGEGSYTNDESAITIPSHSYPDGDYICSVCGHINENFCEMADGFYQLGTAKDVEWFAAFVNSGNPSTNAMLTTDIDMYEIDNFSGIGEKSLPYTGHFDGQYHRISNLLMSPGEPHDWTGFFNFTSGGVLIENMVLAGSCYISGAKGTALIGGCGSGGEVLFRNLGNEGDVKSVTANAAGILGCNFQTGCKVTLINCYSTGQIDGSIESGAIAGWLGSTGATMRNCWSSAIVQGYQNLNKYMARFDSADMSNNFSVEGNQGERFDSNEIESGELTYKMGIALDSPVWFQNLDNGEPVDEMPTTNPSHGIVYPVAEMLCDGSIGGDATYSNNNEVVIPDHQFQDGFCIVCHQEDPDYPFIHVFANADHDVAGGYVNDQSNDGSGLAINNSVAEHWNQQYFVSHQPITGLQRGLYKVRVQGYSRICKWGNLEAYDEGVLNPEMAPLYHNSQYFAEVNGKRIANLFPDITKDAQEASLGGGEENYNEVTNLWVPNSLAAARRYFAKGLYWDTPIYFYVNSEEDEVRIGLENRIYLQGNWTVWDTWRLEYVGELTDENMELIRNQQAENIQNLETLKARVSLEEAYQQAQDSLELATSLDELLSVAHNLSTLPQQIRISHLEYVDYTNAVNAVREEFESRDDLNGEYAELLETYLTDMDEPSDELPNGTFEYIIDERLLDGDGLTAEILFVQELYNMAVRTSLAEGSDLTNLIVNPGMDIDANFTGWQRERTRIGEGDNNLSCQTGYGDIYYVSGSLNSAFRVWQDLEEGLPNGIYEIQIPAYYRPGNKGEGDVVDGTDIISADIFINDYHTPMMNIYKDVIPYNEAINGVNCRYDAVNDPEAPHNGQDTGSQDYDTGVGYVPHQRPGSSFAFNAGRYVNHAYAIVEDGKLTIGVRNTETPWYPGGLAVWGRFQLRYHSKSQDAMEQMLQNFEERLDILKLANNDQDFYISVAHITELENLIAEARTLTDADAKMHVLKQINEEFNTISDSYAIYQELAAMADYCYDEGDKSENIDDYYDVGNEISDHLLTGDLTDEQADDYLYSIMDNETIGGGLYAQGDLLNEDGTRFDYNAKYTLYHFTSLGNGKYEGVFRTQNRANLANADNRAGLYFTILGRTYKATNADHRFVTPKDSAFTIVYGGGADFQMTGGQFKAKVDIKAGSVSFEALEYNWNDRVFVCGSIFDHKGDKHRWVNDEAVSLHHKGDGLYQGFVQFFEDAKQPGFATFCIMSTRSTLNDVPYAAQARPNWTEGRYGGVEKETIIVPDELSTEMVRGKENKWLIAWDETYGEKKYFEVFFDMNRGTLLLQPLSPELEDGILDVPSTMDNAQSGDVYDLSGRRITKGTGTSLGKGIYIIGGRKVLVK